MKKTFIIDIDGTLFSSKWEVLPESITALKAIVNSGNEFILASGRPIDSLRTIAEKLPVKPTFLIGSNGSAIYDFINKKVHKERKVPQEFINELISYKGILEQKIIFQKTDSTFGYNLNPDDYVHLQNFSLGKTTEIKKDEISNLEGASMVGLMGWRVSAWPKYQDIIYLLVNKYRLEMINMKMYDFIDIFPGAGSKGQALSWLAIQGLINRKNCYAFGDGLNDIEMLQFAEYSYAMGQSSLEVQSYAKFVIGTNDEPSIANKILSILKEK